MTPSGMEPRETVALDDWKLATFLYILLRDHLTAGQVEGIMRGHIEHAMSTAHGEFSNPWILAHAENLTERLRVRHEPDPQKPDSFNRVYKLMTDEPE